MVKLIQGKLIVPSRSEKGKYYSFDAKTLLHDNPCQGFIFRKTCWHYEQVIKFVQSGECVDISSQIRSFKYSLPPKDPFNLNSDTHGY